MRKTRTTKQLNVVINQNTIRKILAVGREFDVNKNGLFDTRSGCVNIWCSPEDKPDYWDVEITQGALEYPREYVGGLYWEWEDFDNKFHLYIEVTPYSLLNKDKTLSEESWQKCTEWVEKQAWNLIRLAKIHEENLGTCCPFCDFVLPLDRLLNDLISHIVEKHGEVKSIILGSPTTIETNKGIFELKNKSDI